MKVTNIILSILVLLLAITSAVFSYLLFSKRAQMLGGWDKFATAINTTSAAIDSGSGTTTAEELSKANLSHKNYAQLSELIEKYNNQITDLVAQRDKQTEALYLIGTMSGLKAPSAQDLRKTGSYADATTRVVNGVKNNNATHRRAMAYVMQELSPFDITADTDGLLQGKTEAKEEFSRKIRERQEEYQDFQAALNEISSMSFRSNHKSKISSAAAERAQIVNKEMQDLKSQLENANNEREALLIVRRQMEKRVAEINGKLNAQENQIQSIRKALGLNDGETLPNVWQDGSVEARTHLTGKVIEVNTHYGYIGINIGQDTRVNQQLSKTKVGKVDPRVEEGLRLKVYRGYLDDGTPDYVANITINKVGAVCSIANIPVGATIKVGDSVLFEKDPPDAAENIKIRVNEMVKKLDPETLAQLQKALDTLGAPSAKKTQEFCAWVELNAPKSEKGKKPANK